MPYYIKRKKAKKKDKPLPLFDKAGNSKEEAGFEGKT